MNQIQSYLGNPNVKRDGILQVWSPDILNEYKKCMDDPVYFAEQYVKVISLDSGLVSFKLYPYQKEMFSHFNDSRFSIVLACRQSGKSISACAYLLWFALFHPEKTVAILANKGATAREMLSRITLMLENIPFFLQPGCKALNKGSIEFSNNSRILAAATSGSSIRGLSVNLLYLDEFAFVERAAEFYTSTYPVVSAGKDTKIIITSTANGIGNMFYNIWQGAEQKVNQFQSFRVDWWDVPGRDDKWKQETIANTSQLQFDQEFGNTFFGTGDTLINAETLMRLRAKNPHKVMENGDLLVYEETKKDNDYIMTVDVAKGRGQDYSTFNLIDISVRPFRQVAVYRNNTISPILFPNIIYKYAKVYNNAYVVVESNDQGSVVCNGLYHDLEYENVHVQSTIKANAIGIEMNRKVKRLGCSAAKDLLENNKLTIVDEHTILEMSTFEARGQSYEASEGNHDDLMMNLVMFGYFASTQYFGDMTDIDLKQMLFNQKMKEIEDDLVPFGFVDDGSQYNDEIQKPEWFVEFDVN
ncbi:MAG: terminase [Verrucomicrobiales bacterium]|nr:terminase [Verrucomicrobiales bacterium]